MWMLGLINAETFQPASFINNKYIFERRSVCSCAFSFQGRQSQIACPMLNCKVFNGSLSSLYTWLKCVILFYTLLVSRTMTHAQSLWWCEHEGRSLLLGYTQIKHFLNIWIIIYMCFYTRFEIYTRIIKMRCVIQWNASNPDPRGTKQNIQFRGDSGLKFVLYRDK